MKFSRCAAALFWASSLLLVSIAYSQITDLPADTSPAPVKDPRRIVLDVVVTDKSGSPVPGLTEQDFAVIDNKAPEKLVSFQAVPGSQNDPIEVVLLIDRVNVSFDAAAQEREQVKKFLRSNGGELRLPTSMIFFSDKGTQIQEATKDASVEEKALDESDSALRTVRRSQGIYGAGDRTQMSVRALDQIAAYEARKPGRKLLIWVSPGWPLLSGPRIDLSPKDQQSIFNTIVAVTSDLRQARITLYSVDPLGLADAGGLRTSYYREFLKGVRKPNQVQIGNMGLQVFAEQSGGRVFTSSNDIASQIDACIKDATAYYVMAFDSPPADGPNEYHQLTIKLDKPGLTARTREGYYAQP